MECHRWVEEDSLLWLQHLFEDGRVSVWAVHVYLLLQSPIEPGIERMVVMFCAGIAIAWSDGGACAVIAFVLNGDRGVVWSRVLTYGNDFAERSSGHSSLSHVSQSVVSILPLTSSSSTTNLLNTNQTT